MKSMSHPIHNFRYQVSKKSCKYENKMKNENPKSLFSKRLEEQSF